THPVIDRARERAPLVVEAALHVGPQRGFESQRLRRADVGAGDRRIDRAVEHQTTCPIREQLRIGRAQERPIGIAEVIELLVSQDSAEEVHVAGRVHGGDVGQDPLAVALAGVGEPLVRGLLRGLALVAASRAGGDVVEVGVLLRVVEAGDGRGLADP
ncbi:hypothetical protein ABE10_00300, partial [Bacillus toyonensis]|nr:hypothetical protein [Bacillus toyonensis]